MPQVIIEQPGLPPMTVPLAMGETNFGRSESSDVVLIADEVSRHHAKIAVLEGRVVLYDLKSLNGTYVNRQRVIERVLSHMDEIWFGSKCRLIYRDDTHFGKKPAPSSGPRIDPRPSDSKLLQSVDRIREEMDRVGNNMTMIGRRDSTPVVRGTPTAEPLPSPDELVQMGRAYRRLSALYRASQIMAGTFDLDERLSQLLDLILETLHAERGFVMLCEESTSNLNVRIARKMGRDLDASSPSMGIAGRAAIDGEPVLMADSALDSEFGMRESVIRHQITAAMCVPLRVDKRIIGSIYMDTRQSETRFDESDLELFSSLANQSALAIDNVRLHEQVLTTERKRENLGRFLSPSIVEKIMSEEGSRLELGGRKQIATTMFCDIRGSSRIAEQLPPDELIHLLNEHFTAMTAIIFDHQGTLDKYIGDEMMAVFGAPVTTGSDVLNAVRAAAAIQARNEELNVLRRQEQRPELYLGIGINTGEVIAGYLGSPQRMEFTVVGDSVNTAKRFCDMAEAGRVVIGAEVQAQLGDLIRVRPIGTVMLKGKMQPTHAYEMVALAEQLPSEG